MLLRLYPLISGRWERIYSDNCVTTLLPHSSLLIWLIHTHLHTKPWTTVHCLQLLMHDLYVGEWCLWLLQTVAPLIWLPYCSPYAQSSFMFASNFSSSATAELIVWLLSLMSAISSASERLSASPPCFIQVMSRLVLSRTSISSIGYFRQRPCGLFSAS